MLTQVRRFTCSLCVRLLAAGFSIGVAGVTECGAETYLIDVKDTEHNLPSSIVTAITQTPDGYLWVGTYDGLSRFDGERFVNFHPINTPELSHARVQGLFVDATGTLWIATYRGGLTSYREGVFRQEWPDDETWFDLHTRLVFSSESVALFATQFGEVLERRAEGRDVLWKAHAPPAGLRPRYQCTDHEGRLWFLTRDARVLLFEQGAFKELPPDSGLSGRPVSTVRTDANGRVWVGAENEIARWNGTRFEDMTPTNGEPRMDPVVLFPTRSGAVWVWSGEHLRKLEGRRWTAEAVEWRGLLGWASGRAMGAHEDFNGGIWFNHYGNGLFHITPDGQYQRLTSADGLPGDRVGAWFQSRDGGIWLGIDRGGLVRLRERRFDVLGLEEGLPVRTTLSICEDETGAMWIGTGGGGLCRWKDGRVTRFSVGASVSANFVFSLYPRPEGGLWFSAGEGEDLGLFAEQAVQPGVWNLHAVKSILVDRSGRTWVGTKSSLAWWTPTDRRVFGTNDGLALSAVRALAEGPDGTVWSGSDDGTLYRCEPDRVHAFRAEDALAEQPIWSLLADAEGAVWAGTFWGGLLRFKNGQFFRFTVRQGIPANVISQILEDGQGYLWLGTHQGILRVSKAGLNAVAEGLTNRVDCIAFGRLDGLPTLECSDGYQPTCWRARDGRLWFTTIKGVVSINPAKVRGDSPPPPVLVEELRVDGEEQDIRSGRVVIAPGHKQFEFRYTALSFDAARFRYRIVGLDEDWVDAGNRRTALYSHVPPGRYRFEVMASDNQGAWSGAGASLEFRVRPRFYATAWFMILCGTVVVGGVALGVRHVSARKYRRELARLEQQHAIERDRARIARDIHDDMGAGLTQITLLSELALRDKEQALAHLERISDSARQLTRAMDEIVWAVDPQHDTFNGLVDYISAYAEDFLRTAGVRCRMDVPTQLPAVHVDAELRYNLFLATKEALNNVVKHANATEVWLRLKVADDGFALIIEDDGKGFSGPRARPSDGAPGRPAAGSGLTNLDRRLSAVGGRCTIASREGAGTRVEFVIRFGAGSPVVGNGRAGGRGIG